jgi:hypothetical protein
MDGVLADMDWALAERARALFGSGVDEAAAGEAADSPESDAPESDVPAEDAPSTTGDASPPATRLR